MEFRFDASQSYQIDAIEAVAGLLDGQGNMSGELLFEEGSLTLATIPNRLDIDNMRLLGNLQSVQLRNSIRPDMTLETIDQSVATATEKKTAGFPNFSVEMETGTGKTYVYIRTIMELFRRYGLRKFIVVVPSVAVREGCLRLFR